MPEGAAPGPHGVCVKPASSRTEGWGTLAHPKASYSPSAVAIILEEQTAREKEAALWKTRASTGSEGGEGRRSLRTRPAAAPIKTPALQTHRRTQSTGLALLGAGTSSTGFPPRRRADATTLPGGPSPQSAAKSGAQAAGPRWPERFLGWSGPSPDGRGTA